jgi:hypothetical protein
VLVSAGQRADPANQAIEAADIPGEYAEKFPASDPARPARRRAQGSHAVTGPDSAHAQQPAALPPDPGVTSIRGSAQSARAV